MDPQEVAPILGLTANGVAALSSRAVRCYGKHGCRLIFPTQNRWASAVGCSAASATTRGTVSPSGTIGVWLPTWKAARSAVSCRRRWRRSAPSSRWSSCLLRRGRRRGGARQWPGWRGPARRGISGSGRGAGAQHRQPAQYRHPLATPAPQTRAGAFRSRGCGRCSLESRPRRHRDTGGDGVRAGGRSSTGRPWSPETIRAQGTWAIHASALPNAVAGVTLKQTLRILGVAVPLDIPLKLLSNTLGVTVELLN